MNNKILILLVVLILVSGLLVDYILVAQSAITPPARSEVKHVEWSKNAVIYEVNIRQYSKEGTFKAFEKDLPRLKNMGIDILWVMPINPIGEEKRKGKLGNYYSVKDYKGINPEYGNMNDFKSLVKTVHHLGIKIIIDWVPNHTSLDNELVNTHPEYYRKDSLDKLASPFDWSDVVRLDYRNLETRKYMTETMQWWLKETDIDGFKCDFAHMVPIDYWNELRTKLEMIKPVFMLAESDQPELHQKAFDMTYDWKFYHIMNNIAKGKQKATAVYKHFAWVDSIYPGNSYLMQFTSNHDENFWNGSEYERLGKGAKAFAVLSATQKDMLLIYNGQESGFNRRLKFFEKDSISWTNYSLSPFYKKLIALKKRNPALWNGEDGGSTIWLKNNYDSLACSYIREKDNDRIIVITNLSARTINLRIISEAIQGTYHDVFNNKRVFLKKKMIFHLQPWQYLVLERQW
jgi:glycosidase